MSNNPPGNQVATRQQSPITLLKNYLDRLKPQMALALPKHLSPDRMMRIALTEFSKNPQLQQCTDESIAGSMMTAGALGLEPGVNGQGFLVPYNDRRNQRMICTFIPGWKGLVDIVNRSGRANVWTGAVHHGDFFEYELGDRPFIRHRPGDESSDATLTHVYAVGRVTGSEWPVIEVWTVAKVKRHRDQYNKQGDKHYSFKPGNFEAYGRKVPLLQVIKYMPSSVEISNALAANDRAERGEHVEPVIDGDFKFIPDSKYEDDDGGDQDDGDAGQAVVANPRKPQDGGGAAAEVKYFPAEDFEKQLPSWIKLMEGKKKTAEQIIATATARGALTDGQKARILARAKPAEVTVTYDDVKAKLNAATTQDAVYLAMDLIKSVDGAELQQELSALADARSEHITTTGE